MCNQICVEADNSSYRDTVDSIKLSQLVEESRLMREKGQIQVQKR